MTAAISKSGYKHLLEQTGIRPTLQRLAVIEYLAACHSHPSADETHTALSVAYPTLSRTTVFNTLRLFVEKGLAHEVDISADVIRYDFALQTPHAHFQCTRCLRIFDIPFDLAAIAKPEGFVCDNVNLYFKGICPRCRQTPQ